MVCEDVRCTGLLIEKGDTFSKLFECRNDPIDQGIDWLKKGFKYAKKVGSQVVKEGKKAAGISTGKVTESSPKYYIVVARQGAMVRSGVDLGSEQVHGLRRGDVITVVQVVGRRARISDPVEGWISLHTADGEMIVRQTRSYDRQAEQEALNRKFDKLKREADPEGKTGPVLQSSAPRLEPDASISAPVVDEEPSKDSKAVSGLRRIQFKGGDEEGESNLLGEDASAPSSVPIPRLAPPGSIPRLSPPSRSALSPSGKAGRAAMKEKDDGLLDFDFPESPSKKSRTSPDREGSDFSSIPLSQAHTTAAPVVAPPRQSEVDLFDFGSPPAAQNTHVKTTTKQSLDDDWLDFGTANASQPQHVSPPKMNDGKDNGGKKVEKDPFEFDLI